MSVIAESTPERPPFAAAVRRRGTRLTGTPAHRLELRVQSADAYTIVHVWGELYTSRIGELSRLLDGLVRGGRTRVVLDLSRLYDLDGDAIGQLTHWRDALASSGGWLCLAAPRPWVRRLLEHMCLRGTFTVYPTVAEALNELVAGA
ncbi:MAG TPA: STAS domain-containing protein [Actinocrinis sp.]|uniref:STAS domain-containing protein n=1 Tax=Actinocrinis sp. TaxID=1920516 RepID=UPI002D6C7EEC|nr:STAS domain-containing protein [Actinocrinis sp.]HZU55765.1 STAS domain-containing protein [Actinocrinis sp.]